MLKLGLISIIGYVLNGYYYMSDYNINQTYYYTIRAKILLFSAFRSAVPANH